MNKKVSTVLLLFFLMVMSACGGDPAPAEEPETTSDEPETTSEEPYTIGLIMVGPRDDRGWNQAHWDGVQYVLEEIPNTELVWFDKLNPADNPDLTVEQVVDDLVEQGADFIITNSAEMADGTNVAAASHPDIFFIHASGDDALTGDAPDNVSNVMGQMEFGKMIAGCAAAMSTENGKIAYLGPLIDAETRRLVNSTYLGARHCWENERGNDPADLEFEVVWIGFWFNIPGVTLDPTQVVNDFIDGGADVIISGIDTTEAVVVSGQRAAAGDSVLAVPYDFPGACDEAPDICLGVPYYNWGPDYAELVESARSGNWSQEWIWSGPDWDDINNEDTSAVGWVAGPALSDDAEAAVERLIDGLADGSLNLYSGPLVYQDGTEFVSAGSEASDEQIWYTEQLLMGIEGVSE